MSIEILSNEVINQIAAGEMVERPAHMVKELIENSLDAGATKIEVEFSAGGREVRVTDNGSGMSDRDLKLSLERHATSKIKLSDDLLSLSTYGFRGEALASIAAVSKLTMISREKKAKSAFSVESEFGALSGPVPCGGNSGTSIVVEKLFENMPARLKFLKSEAAEHTQIKQVLKAFALIHPEIELRVRQEKPIWSFLAQESLLERAREVLGVSELFSTELSAFGMHARVVFASPADVLGNSKGIWLFVQKRWVQDRTMLAAVNEAYRGLLMHGEFPQVVIDLTLNPADVDVNIHPTKSLVKFKNPSDAFRVVQRALRQALELAPWIPEEVVAPVAAAARAESRAAARVNEAILANAQTQLDSAEVFSRTQLREKSLSAAYAIPKLEPLSVRSPEPSAAAATTGQSPSRPTVTVPSEPKRGYWSGLHVLGQAQQTYILTQSQTGLVIVDQHAAHERVLYEQLMKALADGRFEIQDYLLPPTFDFDADEVEALMKHEPELKTLGISIDQMGPETIAIRAAPAIVKENALATGLKNFAHAAVEQGGSFALEKSLTEIFASLACHSAVRAGQALSREEMQSLLKQMDEFTLSSFCPHGRPVSVDYPFNQLERDFGRIV